MNWNLAFSQQRKKMLETEVRQLRATSSQSTMRTMKTEQTEDGSSKIGFPSMTIEGYQNEISRFMIRLTKMSQKIQELQSIIKDKDGEVELVREEMYKKYDQQELKCQTLKQQLTNLQVDKEKLEKVSQAKIQQVESKLNTQTEFLTEKLSSYQQRAEFCKTQFDSINSRFEQETRDKLQMINDLQYKVRMAEQSRNQLESKSEDQIHTLQGQIFKESEDLKGQLSDYNFQMKTIQKSIDSIKKVHEKEKNTLKLLNEKRIESNEQDGQLRMKRYQKQVTDLEKEIEEISQKKDEELQYLQSLKKQVESGKIEREIRYRKFEHEIKYLNQQIIDLNKTKENEMKKTQEIFQECMKYKSEMADLSRNIERLEYQKQQLIFTFERLQKKQIEEYDIRIDIINKQFKQKHLEKVRELEDKRIQDIQKTQFKNQERVRQIEAFHTQQMKHMKDKIEETSMKQRMEKLELEQNLDNAHKVGTSKVETQYIKFVQEKEELESSWKAKLQDLDDYYKGYVETKQAENNSEMNRAIEQLENKLRNQFEKQQNILEDSHQKQIERIQQDMRNLQLKKNEEINLLKNEMQSKMLALENQLSDLLRQKAELETDYDNIRKEYSQFTNQTEIQNQIMLKKHMELGDQKKVLQAQIENLQTEIQEVKLQSNENQQIMQKTHQEEVHKLLEEHSRFVQDMEMSFQHEKVIINQQMQQLQNEYQEVDEFLKKKDLICKQLQIKVANYDKEYDKLIFDVNQKDLSASDLKTELVFQNNQKIKVLRENKIQDFSIKKKSSNASLLRKNSYIPDDSSSNITPIYNKQNRAGTKDRSSVAQNTNQSNVQSALFVQQPTEKTQNQQDKEIVNQKISQNSKNSVIKNSNNNISNNALLDKKYETAVKESKKQTKKSSFEDQKELFLKSIQNQQQILSQQQQFETLQEHEDEQEEEHQNETYNKIKPKYSQLYKNMYVQQTGKFKIDEIPKTKKY